MPFISSILKSCSVHDDLRPDFELNFKGKVLIIGAGAAGLTAGYLLNRFGIDFKILEAASVFGGRVKRTDNFADFPIDLGAEWIHEDPAVLAKLLHDPQRKPEIEVITYNPKTIYTYHERKLKKQNWASKFYSEHKFKNTTWYGFFEKNIVPNIGDRIVFNSPVSEIDYSGAKVTVKNTEGAVFEADRVLLALPLKILQNESVTFIPELPAEKTDAIKGIDVPDGIKVFIEFSEKFYPDMLFTESLSSLLDESAGERLYYDAAYGKNSKRNILGLFSVGKKASAYTKLATDQEVIAKILGELDEIYAGRAGRTYIKHIVQNWSKEPYIQGAYGIDFPESANKSAAQLSRPVMNKLYFAGDAMIGEDRVSTVPGAAASAYRAINALLKVPLQSAQGK